MKNAKFYLTILTSVIMVVMLFSACGGGNKNEPAAAYGVMDVLKKIPSDASVVAVMNVGQLMSKLDYASFKQTEIFKRMLNEAKSDDAKKILEDPSAAGIATNGQFCMYVQVKGKDNVVGAILMPIGDVKALEALFEKSAKEKDDSPFKKIQDNKDFKFVEDVKDKMNVGMAWNKKMLAISFSSESKVSDCFAEIFDTKRTESILSNKQFKSDKAADHDFMIWMQTDPLLALAKADEEMTAKIKQAIFVTGLSIDDLNENAIALFYDFNKGEMEGGMSYHMNKKIVDEFGGVFKEKVGTDFSSFFPTKNLLSVSLMGLSTSGIYDVVSKRGLNSMVDNQLAAQGITLKEIMEGLEGDVAIASYINPEGTSAMDMQKVVMAIAFKKPELLDKLIEIGNAFGTKVSKNGTRIDVDAAKGMGGAVFVNNVLVLSNDNAILEQIEKGGYKGEEALASEHYKTMSNGWLGTHADYEQLVSSVQNMPGMAAMGDMFKMLSEYNELESATFNVTTESAKVMVYLKNKDENSLKVLSNVANKVYVDRDKIKEQMEKMDKKEEKAEEKETQM